MKRLEWYLHLTEMTQAQLGGELGVSGVSVGRYCHDPEDDRHRRPAKKVAARLKAKTHGVIHLGNYADQMSRDDAIRMMHEIARLDAVAAKAGQVANG